VLFAGITVCITLLGIVVLGLSFLNGLAVASALTVAFTVMPALLGVFGMRVLLRRIRRHRPGHPPVPLRVSITRTGLTGVSNDPLPAVAAA
jgi:RND superfamily putative drug exporter